MALLKRRTKKKSLIKVNDQLGTTEELMLLNIGCLQDIPTATFVKGERGETIVLGGADLSTAVVGPGNSFKSMFAFYIVLTILDRYADIAIIRDTEINMKRNRIINLSKRIGFLYEDLKESFDDFINLTSKSEYYDDTWWNIFKNICKDNSKSKKIKCDGLNTEMLPVMVSMLDSLTEAEPKIASDMLDKAKVESNDTATYYMRTGLFKNKLVGELPIYTKKGNNRMVLTAHTGSKISMADKYNKPDKQLAQLKEDESIKGVSGKFTFLISTVYKSISAVALKNRTTKLPEYPTSGGGTMQETDLYKVKYKILRCKSGATGVVFPIVVSQVEGVLSSLTEFDYLKDNGRFGFVGNDRNYVMALAPDIKLQRTEVRDKIDGTIELDEGVGNYKLCRAINMQSELLQLRTYHGYLNSKSDNYLCTPEELYEDLKNMGYDWDELLSTRGWYHPNNYNIKELGAPLSIIDLLNMRIGEYIPFWYTKEQKAKIKKKD